MLLQSTRAVSPLRNHTVYIPTIFVLYNQNDRPAANCRTYEGLCMQTTQNPESNIIDAFLALSIIAGLVTFYFLFPLNLTFVLILLVGVWWLDAYVKRMLRYENSTAFADLSFSALIFLGTQSINLAKSGINPTSVDNAITKVLVFTAITGFIWLGNLSTCGGLNHQSNLPWQRVLIWFLSLLFAILSVIFALYIEYTVHIGL